jgi:hypothetical protein
VGSANRIFAAGGKQSRGFSKALEGFVLKRGLNPRSFNDDAKFSLVLSGKTAQLIGPVYCLNAENH